MELCPRALRVLKRQLALRARMKLEGKIGHENVFFKGDGSPIRNLQYPWVRWRSTLTVRLKARYRDPYNARHTSVTWYLMLGKNPLWVAKQHGHSVQTMLETYAAWLEGTTESDLRAIERAMHGPTGAATVVRARATNTPRGLVALPGPLQSPGAVTTQSLEAEDETQVPVNWWNLLAEREGFE